MNQIILTLGQFLRRDAYIFHKRIRGFFLNYGLLYPALYVACFGYMIPLISKQVHQTTLLFVGSIVLLMQVVAYVVNIDFLFDLEKDRFVEYQISILPAPFVLCERILFSTLLTFVLSLPFFPIAGLLLGSRIDFSHTSWPLLIVQLFLASWFCSSLNIFGFCFITHSKQLGNLWTWFFRPMFMLGGFQVPRVAMAKVSPFLDYISYINPMIYISEGIRSIIIGGPSFIPYYLCFVVLIGFSFLFMSFALYYFKQRIDHI